MKNTDFMNLSLPEGTDKIDIEILNSDFTAIENLLEQHAIIETMTLNGEGVIIGAIGPYIRLQNIDTVQVSIDIGNETYTLASGENIVIRETAENIGIITSGNVHITYFVNPKTYADKEFYTKEKVDELLSNVEATVEVDAELSETSENPVQNKIITEQFSHYYTAAETINAIIEKVAEIVAGAPEDFDTLKELSDWLTEHEDSAARMNSAIQENKTNINALQSDVKTANTNIQANVDDITAIKELLNVKKYGRSCFTKDSTQNELLPRDEMYIKENGYGWSFNLYVTYISKIPANTSTVIGTISPPPPRPMKNRNVKIYTNNMDGTITDDAIVSVNLSGQVSIISPVAVREDGATGHYGRINNNACVFEALKFGTAAVSTTTEGGE